ncbi:hypothetical protein [Streptomyces sp. NPDC012825]|uniref:hypothetical protein n=1 Tax=Streptomyces sp. NPDC012825 TaxID=3364851 RepID=UPI0036AC18D4
MVRRARHRHLRAALPVRAPGDAADPAPPVLDAVIDDFARYHVAMAVIAVADTTTAAAPGPALSAFLDGGW